MDITVPEEMEEAGRRRIAMEMCAANIRKARRGRNMTQEQVAERAGINPKYLGEIERGIKSPTAAVVYRLSSALNVPVCALISARRCPCDNGDLLREVGSLLEGRKERDVRKAMKILAVLFE